MIVNREDIAKLDIIGYIEWLAEYPKMLVLDVLELECAKIDVTDLAVRKWNWHCYEIQSIRIGENFEYWYNIFCRLCTEKIEQKKIIIDKKKSSRTELGNLLLMYNTISVDESIHLDSENLIKKLDESNLEAYGITCKKLAYSLVDVFKEDINKKKFDSGRIERKIREFEERDFSALEHIINSTPYMPFYSSDVSLYLCAYELAELIFYKELVCGETENVQQQNILSMSERLVMLKDVGLFDLPYFSINPRTAKVSEREQSKLLAKILGCNEDNIRKAIRKVRK